MTKEHTILSALENLTHYAEMVDKRLDLLRQEADGGQYPCAAFHAEFSIAVITAKKVLAKATGQQEGGAK